MPNVIEFPIARDFHVVRSDAMDPPAPPEGAHAVEVRALNGTVIAFGWVHPSVSREMLVDTAYAFADRLTPTPASSERSSAG